MSKSTYGSKIGGGVPPNEGQVDRPLHLASPVLRMPPSGLPMTPDAKKMNSNKNVLTAELA